MKNVRQDIGLVIVGGEPKYHDEYNRLIESYSLMDRVRVLPAVLPNEVISICSVADVGIHPIENTCLNHFYCLPNKIFQYIGFNNTVSFRRELICFLCNRVCSY